jgi:hypothetical protein
MGCSVCSLKIRTIGARCGVEEDGYSRSSWKGFSQYLQILAVDFRRDENRQASDVAAGMRKRFGQTGSDRVFRSHHNDRSIWRYFPRCYGRPVRRHDEQVNVESSKVRVAGGVLLRAAVGRPLINEKVTTDGVSKRSKTIIKGPE